MKKLLLIFFLLIFLADLSYAQSVGSVGGSVKDPSGKALEFVNVMLLAENDSSLVKGAVTDPNGNFLIEGVAFGRYKVAVTQVGLEKVYSKTFTLDEKIPAVKIPDLSMGEDVKLLNEITVESTKPFIEQEIDRMVINVENSIVSSGSNALEVLEKAPGVTIDKQNDQIQLKGKAGVMVLIDGKQTYLSGQDIANLLKSTSSDNIEKIEIITNPSSKYDAAGNTGIINIRMKKNKNFGTNGSATLGVGYGKFEKANGSLLLNNRTKKMNVFGNYSYHFNKAFGENTLNRVMPNDGSVIYFDQETYRPNKYNGQNFRGGIDFFISSKSTFGFLLTGFSNRWEQFNAENKTVISDANRQVTLRPTTIVDIDNERTNLTGNVNYKYDFDGKGKEFTMDMDYSQYTGDNYNDMTTTYTDANFNPARPTEIVRNLMPSEIGIWAAKADYVHPTEKGKWEAGIKSSYVQADNNLVFETLNDNQWVNDEKRSNHFKYEENINAAYVNFNTKLNEKTSIQTGLRVEQTYSLGNSMTLNEKVKRNYTDLFPTFFLTRQIDSSNVLNMSYSRRVDRPNYQDLNPFVFYLDPYTYQKGNPYLQPQYTHSMQLTHIYKSKFSTSLGYSRTSDFIVQEAPGQIPEENITFVQAQNLAVQDNFNVTISTPIKIRNWWNIQANLTLMYNSFNAPYLDDVLDIKIFSYNAYMANNFVLGKGFSAELSGWYNSKTMYSFYKTEPMGAFSIGVQKSMLDKKLTLKLNVNDPLWLNRFRGSTQYGDIDFKIQSRWESRVARFTLAYNFGNQNVKGARQRSTSTEAERNRAGGGN